MMKIFSAIWDIAIVGLVTVNTMWDREVEDKIEGWLAIIALILLRMAMR